MLHADTNSKYYMQIQAVCKCDTFIVRFINQAKLNPRYWLQTKSAWQWCPSCRHGGGTSPVSYPSSVPR